MSAADVHREWAEAWWNRITTLPSRSLKRLRVEQRAVARTARIHKADDDRLDLEIEAGLQLIRRAHE